MTASRSSFSAYVDGLPAGLESYPECESKGSLIRSTLDGHDLAVVRDELPAALAELVEVPPPPSVWVPAAHGIALVHAVCDVYYPTDAKVLEWGARRAEALASNRLYRALVRVSGPRVLFSMTARLNRLFQRGTSFEVEGLEPGRVDARLSFPPRLHTRRSLLGTVSLCRTLVELTGGTCLRAEMTRCDETEALFECEWSTGAG